MIFFKKSRFILLSLALALLGACARENMRISPTVFYEKPKVLVGQMSGFEEAHFYKEGTQGWADMIINHVITSPASDRLKNINIQPLLDEAFYIPFQGALANKATWVRKLEKTIFKEELCSLSHEEKISPYDFSFLKHQYDADFALIIDPHNFGSSRNYYGFIPLGAPVGVANFSIYFVRLCDNTLFGLYNSENSTPVQGDWDSPPEYYELIQSIKSALSNGLKDGFGFLFPDLYNR